MQHRANPFSSGWSDEHRGTRPSVALPLDTHVVAGAPLAVLPAAPSAAAPPQLQLTQTLQTMAEDDAVDLFEDVLLARLGTDP